MRIVRITFELDTFLADDSFHSESVTIEFIKVNKFIRSINSRINQPSNTF